MSTNSKMENDLLLEDDRDVLLKWNGWGYKDSYFYIEKDGSTAFSGDRYEICGRLFPDLHLLLEESLNTNVFHFDAGEESFDRRKIPEPMLNMHLIKWLDDRSMAYSIDGLKRVHRSHGHAVQDLMKLRLGECEDRIPDLIVWPKNHKEVVDIVIATNEIDFVIIPIGGGTSVSGALKCPESEKRCIVSLDMARMNKILWLDEKNLLARAECGILGAKLEEKLNEKGYTLGHEPDSFEFSSLGGWVATRASGIKKNKYGNIEDMVVHVTLVTPKGVVQKSCTVPRLSSGPDIHHFIIGSEGTLGVVTEVTLKICGLPECQKFGSILFPTFEHGVKALREIARQRIAPASIRLMDSEQFKFGRVFKPALTFWSKLVDKLKMFYVTKWMKFDLHEMSPATLLLEGAAREVNLQEKRIYEIAANFGVMNLCTSVKELCKREVAKRGIQQPPYISYRVTQLYDAGACIYFYFAFNYKKLPMLPEETTENWIKRALHVYEEIEALARNEILSLGGSISHHHGIGKIRKRWMPQVVGSVGLSALAAVKQSLDPKNVFACGNLFTITSNPSSSKL